MPANTSPIYPLTPNAGVAGVVLTAANTAKDGTGTTALLFTAGANGARLDKIRAKAAATNVATVARFFLNNGSTPATAANNIFIGELALAAVTLTEVAAQVEPEWVAGFPIPAGWRVYVCIATAVAGGWAFAALGGDY